MAASGGRVILTHKATVFLPPLTLPLALCQYDEERIYLSICVASGTAGYVATTGTPGSNNSGVDLQRYYPCEFYFDKHKSLTWEQWFATASVFTTTTFTVYEVFARPVPPALPTPPLPPGGGEGRGGGRVTPAAEKDVSVIRKALDRLRQRMGQRG